MNALSRLLVAPTLATALLLVCGPTNAARRVGVSPYDGTWSVVIYTLRGDCGSVRVAAQRRVPGRVTGAINLSSVRSFFLSRSDVYATGHDVVTPQC